MGGCKLIDVDDKRHLKLIQPDADIIDYGIKPSPGQMFIDLASGPALYTNKYHPQLSKTHSLNYQWYATVSKALLRAYILRF